MRRENHFHESSANQVEGLNKKPNAAQLTRNFETTMKVQWAQELSQNWIHFSPTVHVFTVSDRKWLKCCIGAKGLKGAMETR